MIKNKYLYTLQFQNHEFMLFSSLIKLARECQKQFNYSLTNPEITALKLNGFEICHLNEDGSEFFLIEIKRIN